ncbi:hypothetical protein DH2020_001720 [Rehmannia glutinosa]|uniref:RCC1-like domain-containing protein n=1 Tax=Rehmannia glutinosa TaxID=99300 RepID=A0ABR0XSD6_REHGL
MEETPNPTQPSNISGKIISIAAGEAHTLALTGDGKVYSWGRGTFGRLGTDSEEDRHLPVRVSFFGSDDGREDELKIVGIAAGAYHSLALADGQIGVTGENHLIPHLLEGFFGLGSPGSSTQDDEMKSGKQLKISSVIAGGMMSLAIDNHGASSSSLNFHGHTVVKVACGNEHVIALVSAGETYNGSDLICYSWGGNNYGQLGLGDNESRLQPEIIEKFNLESPWEVYDIACGASHTALLAKRKKPSDTLESFCWTFGLGDNGQLGHGTTQSLAAPEIVRELPKSIFLVSVDCGLFHTSVVSSDGEVWSWGMEKGLGLCPDARFTGTDPGDALSPLLIPCNGVHNRKFENHCKLHVVGLTRFLFRILGLKFGHGGGAGVGSSETVNELNNEYSKENNSEESMEMEKRLSAAMVEMKLLQSKVSIMERYAGILHGSIFGKPFEEREIPASLKNSGTFDIAKEWENMLESLDQRNLARLEMFYRDMRAGVKDKLLKRRVQEMVKECLNSNATTE